ncbi:respiratory nitrate reductase subunit gamma [Streptomycetaceae bacterium NBC_01309]
MTSTADVMLWGVLPYVSAALLIAGTYWRYRYDKFGWTTRSSELYESRLLRIASPLFHYGLLFVFAGHILGLLMPQGSTDAVGMSEHAYHVMAMSLGLVAGVATVVGIGLLIWRRRTTGPVFLATTRNDKLMYVALATTILAGLATTLIENGFGRTYNYRETVSPWFRSLFAFRPDIDLMAAAPVAFHVHAVLAFVLFALLPFTRLVHAFSAPVKYLFRPYLVYRSRDPQQLASRPTRRGWDRVDS